MTVLASGTDINTVIKVGFYTGTNLANAPSTDWITLIHMIINNDTDYNVQIAKVINTATLYIREQRNGTWDSWTSLATNDALANTTATANAAYTKASNSDLRFYCANNYWAAIDENFADLNNIKITGSGCVRSGYDTNYPPDTDGWGDLTCFKSSGNRFTQIFYAWNYNRYYIRSFEIDTWQSWQKLITSNCFSLSGTTLTITV